MAYAVLYTSSTEDYMKIVIFMEWNEGKRRRTLGQDGCIDGRVECNFFYNLCRAPES